jgi:hypothetical protein
VEGLRSKLKLLAARGWLAGVPAGCSPCRITQGKRRNPDSKGFFFLGFGGASQTGPQERRILMAAYATVPPDDPFAVSKAMFAAFADKLAGPAVAVLTACELEELIDEESRKAIRQLLQDHYDLRALREEQQARKRPAPVTGTDGITRPGWRPGTAGCWPRCSAR